MIIHEETGLVVSDKNNLKAFPHRVHSTQKQFVRDNPMIIHIYFGLIKFSFSKNNIFVFIFPYGPKLKLCLVVVVAILDFWPLPPQLNP